MAVKVKKSVKKTVPVKSTTTPPIVVKAKVKVKIGGSNVKDSLKKGK